MTDSAEGRPAAPIGRGLFMGRFQPFHLGHLTAVKAILDDLPEAIIGVAAVEANLSWQNPFSCGERMEMIWGSLDRDERSRCLVVPVPDNQNNVVWLGYLRQYVPPFTVSLTNNPLQTLIMRAAGIEVRPIPLLRRSELQGSIIRELLAAGDARWETLVPEGSAGILRSVGAQERLATLNEMREGNSDGR